jgi:predicted PurR-regulated permease PerM
VERPGIPQRLVTFAASVVVIAALYLAKGVLMPLAVAVVISFLLAPLVLRLQRWRFSRGVAVMTAMLLVCAVVAGAGWLVVGQVRDVTTNLAQYEENIRFKMSALRGAVAKPVQETTEIVENLGTDLAAAVVPGEATPPIQTVRIAEPTRAPLAVLGDALGPTFQILAMAGMTVLFAFVMLLRWDDLGDRFIRLVGHGQILVTTRALAEGKGKVASYLWRLLLLNGLHGFAVWIGLALIGVPNALLWGLLAAILRFIPYVGPWIAATFPVLTALAVSPEWTQPLMAIGLFAFLELVSNNILEPWIYGNGTGISPLAILVSAMFWAWLWGPVGLVLSTPLTVCLVVMGKYVPQLRFLHWLFGDEPALSPPARLYQRLVAGDQDQAWLVVRKEAEEKPLHEVYDSIVLPVLSMAEHDRQRGSLEEADEARIEDTMRMLLEEAGDAGAASEDRRDAGAAAASPDPLRALCIPARGSADALAATMLRQVLELDGVRAEVSSTAELSGETLDRVESAGVDVVCISAVLPSGFMHVRYLCKRIAGRFPGMPIVAGMWNLRREDQEHVDRLPILEGVHVVSSLGEARTEVRQLAESVRIQRDAGVQPVARTSG